MSIIAGSKLGPYEILSAVGAGGMGEVFKARDTRLDRTVAIKVLSSQLVASPELRARFEREAKVISQLQHPNICVLHDVGSENGIDFLVMEFLEGEALSEKVKCGPLSWNELLKVAIEIANALGKAHRSGVIHRDLKAGNVMLTKSGAKLLDFGLAKPSVTAATAGASSSASVFAAALTMTSPASPLSTAGAVIGTVQYMAPEQIQGQDADARSDVFAFGVVLYEMATGKRAFEGKTQSSVVGQILAVDPPSISSIQPTTPAELSRLVATCLAKDPEDRFQTIHDVKLRLAEIAESPSVASAKSAKTSGSVARWILFAATAVVVLLVGTATYFAFLAMQPRPVVRASLVPPDKTPYYGLSQTRIDDIRAAALLHDIGKLDISRDILYKAARLTKEEFDEMKQHVEKGMDILEPVGGTLRRVLPIILSHHDKFDGTGYHPTKGEEIPLEARIISVADVYDSLTSDRPYRKAMSTFDAKEIIEKGSGVDFDPRVVSAFLVAFRRHELEVPEVVV